MTDLPVSVTFASDWRVGTGNSRSKRVDRAVLTDDVGLPYVPAKTLTGLLRYRAEQIADGLDGERGGPWTDWVTYVFGSQPNRKPVPGSHARSAPVPAALVAAPLYLDTDLRELVSANRVGVLSGREIAAAATMIRPGIAVDEATGTAKPDFLRFDEVARAGLVVSAVWSIEPALDDPDWWPAHFLLAGAARLVYAVGGGRRRGLGECIVAFDPYSPTLLKQWAERAATHPAPGVPGRGTPAGTPIGPLPGQPVHAHDLRVRLTEPVLVGTTVTANVTESAPVIPGSVLLPIVLGALGTRHPDLVRDARVIVTDATPERAGLRSVTLPHTVALRKGDSGGPATFLTDKHASDPKLKSRDARVIVEDGKLRRADIAKVQRLHAVVEDDTQGPDNLFVTKALAPGATFRAQVWLPDGYRLPDDAFADTPIRLGTSTKDDYGRATITVEPPATSGPPAEIAAGTPIAVYLASDVVLLGDRGRSAPSVATLLDELTARLSETTKTTLRQLDPDVDAADRTVRFGTIATTTRIDSWQTRWGLPRPTISALAAGSVLMVAADRDLTGAEVADLQNRPIGVRTVEGFGRIQLNPAWLASALQLDLTEPPPAASTQPGPPALSTQPAMGASARPLVVAALRARIETAATGCAAKHAADYLPRNAGKAQINVLRGLIENLHTEEGWRAFDRWAKKVHEIDTRSGWREPVKRLRKLLSSDSDLVWQMIFPGAPEPADRAVLDELAPFARRVLLLAMIRARQQGGAR